MVKTKKQCILDEIENVVTKFLYYDRKEDEDLPVDSIERCIKRGNITVDEMVDKFRECLSRSFKG